MKTLTLILSATILALAGVGYGLYERNTVLVKDNKVLTEASKRAEARELEYRRILGTRSKEIASQARKLAQAQGALSEALTNQRAWADQPVPKEVVEALANGS